MIIFIVGGTTYEESRVVAQQNATASGIRFILGGSAILNSKRYAADHIIIYIVDTSSRPHNKQLLALLTFNRKENEEKEKETANLCMPC